MHRRLLRIALVTGLLASMTAVLPVQAAERTTSVPNKWGTMGVWGTYTDFAADWEVTKAYNGSTLMWRFTHVGLTASVENGMDCPPLICENWSFGGNFRFLDANGNRVGDIQYPSSGFCHTGAWNARNRNFGRCRLTTIWMPLSVTQIQFNWSVSLRRTQDGLSLTPWSASKKVQLS